MIATNAATITIMAAKIVNKSAALASIGSEGGPIVIWVVEVAVVIVVSVVVVDWTTVVVSVVVTVVVVGTPPEGG
jgi:hypothetical protein